jgi:hypothetical protein
MGDAVMAPLARKIVRDRSVNVTEVVWLAFVHFGLRARVVRVDGQPLGVPKRHTGGAMTKPSGV